MQCNLREPWGNLQFNKTPGGTRIAEMAFDRSVSCTCSVSALNSSLMLSSDRVKHNEIQISSPKYIYAPYIMHLKSAIRDNPYLDSRFAQPNAKRQLFSCKHVGIWSSFKRFLHFFKLIGGERCSMSEREFSCIREMSIAKSHLYRVFFFFSACRTSSGRWWAPLSRETFASFPSFPLVFQNGSALILRQCFFNLKMWDKIYNKPWQNI